MTSTFKGLLTLRSLVKCGPKETWTVETVKHRYNATQEAMLSGCLVTLKHGDTSIGLPGLQPLIQPL